MGLGHLPWPIFVFLSFTGGLFLVINGFLMKKKTPKILAFSFVSLGLGGILFGIIKIGQTFNYFKPFMDIMFLVATACAVIPIPLVFIGGYQKVKSDEQQRKKAIRAFIGVGLFLLFNILFVLFFWLKNNIHSERLSKISSRVFLFRCATHGD